MSAVQSPGKFGQRHLLLIAAGLKQGHQRRIGGAGNLGIRKGDPPTEGRSLQIRPACKSAGRHQLGIVHQHHGEGGKGCPVPRLRLELFQNQARLRTDVRGEAVLIGFQAFHTAAEHNIRRGGVRFRLDPLQKLIGAAADYIHPDTGAILKFPNDGGVYLLLMGSIYHQTLCFLRGAGKLLRLLRTAARKESRKQRQGKDSFLHIPSLHYPIE